MKTAAVFDLPVIGVVAANRDLAQLVVAATQNPAVEVVISSIGDSTASKYYKMVLWADINAPLSDEDLNWLNQLGVPCLILFPYVSPVLAGFGEPGQSWAQYHRQQRALLAKMMAQLPSALFCLIHNLFFATPDYQVTTDLNWLTSSLEKGVLVDPAINISITTWQDVAPIYANLVSRPHSAQTILISSPACHSEVILKDLQSLAVSRHGEHPDILINQAQLDTGFPPFGHDYQTSRSTKLVINEILPHLNIPRAIPGYNLPQPTVNNEHQSPSGGHQRSILSTGSTPVAQSMGQTGFSFPHAGADINSAAGPAVNPTTSTDFTSPHFSVSQTLSTIFNQNNAIQKQNYLVSLAKTEVKEGKRSKRRKRLFLFGAVSIGGALGALVLFGLLTVNTMLVKNTVLAAIEKMPDSRDLIGSQTIQKRSLDLLAFQTQIYDAIFSSSSLDEAKALIKAADLHDKWVSEKTTADGALRQLVDSIIGGKSEIGDSAQNAVLHSRSAYENWTQLKTDLAEVDLSQNDKKTAGLAGDLENRASEQNKNLIKAEKLLPVISKIAQAKQFTLAIFFQNSQELRPTGGFLQSLALLSFENGRWVSTSAYSSYGMDGKIQGRVDAPDEIRANLGETNYYFRDSNWDPNFPTSMQKSGWFVEKGLNKPIDGALAINSTALPTLLAAIGPIELPAYNEVITPNNVTERLEFHSEIQLTPGSNDYATVLLQTILENVKKLSPDKAVALLSAIDTGLEQQDLLLAFNDKDIQKNITELGWSGSILTPPCPSQFSSPPCQVDAFAQMEANIGVNKANFYLEKSLTNQVILSKTAAKHVRTVKYTNTSKSNAWPRGPYRAYIRLYLPTNAAGVEVTFNQTKLAGQTIKTYPEYNRQVVAFPIEVPINTTRDLIISYTTPLNGEGEGPLSYVLFDQKQPGTTPVPVKTTIELDAKMSPTLVAPQAEVLENKLIFHTTTSSHLIYGVLAK